MSLGIKTLGLGLDVLINSAGELEDIALALLGLIPTDRQCLIKIQNLSSKHELSNPHMYIYSGHNYCALPSLVRPGHETTMYFVKTPNAARGSVAVVTYDIKDPIQTTKRLAIMFSVPYDFNVYSNWFAVGAYYKEDKHCDYSLYKEMYYNDFGEGSDFVRQRGGRPLSFRKWQIRVEATMADTYTPNILIKFNDDHLYPSDDASGGK